MATTLQLVLVAVAALVARTAATCELSGPLDLGRSLTVDAVHTAGYFAPGTVRVVVWQGSRYTNNDFCVGEHAGTHLDAPFHFNNSAWTTDQIPINRLIANGVFLNVTEEAAGNASFRLQATHIDRWIEQNGAFPSNAVLLISYGWAQLYHNSTRYFGTTSTNLTEFVFPGMTSEAANRLAGIEQLVGVGVDTPSIDASGDAVAHNILAARNVYNLEHVDLDQPCLPAKGFKVYSLPANVVGGTGAPARILAVPSCST